jgi:hypothetical protein
MNKMMTWYGIQMKTMKDHTTSKLSELLMQGTNMGIIEGRRLLNQNDEALEYLDKVVEIFPDNEDAHEMIRRLS